MVAADQAPTVANDGRSTGRSMQIEVAGRILTVRSDAPEARVNAVVDDLNQRIERLREQSGVVSLDQVVLMTALNMAEELVTLRERHDALKAKVQDRSQRLLATLDQLAEQALSEDGA